MPPAISRSHINLIAAEREMEKQLYLAAKKLRENPKDVSQAFMNLFFAINDFNRIYQGMDVHED